MSVNSMQKALIALQTLRQIGDLPHDRNFEPRARELVRAALERCGLDPQVRV